MFIFASDPNGIGLAWVKKIMTVQAIYQKYHPTTILCGNFIGTKYHQNQLTLMFVENQIVTNQAIGLLGEQEYLMLQFLLGENEDWLKPENSGQNVLREWQNRESSFTYRDLRFILKRSHLITTLQSLKPSYTTKNIIFVHGGVYPLASLYEKTPLQFKLTAQEEYLYNLQEPYFAHNYTQHTIISGKIPTNKIIGKYEQPLADNIATEIEIKRTNDQIVKIQYPNEPARIFTRINPQVLESEHDSGSVIVVDENGNLIAAY